MQERRFSIPVQGGQERRFYIWQEYKELYYVLTVPENEIIFRAYNDYDKYIFNG